MIDRTVHHTGVPTLKGFGYRILGRGGDPLPRIRTTTDDERAETYDTVRDSPAD